MVEFQLLTLFAGISTALLSGILGCMILLYKNITALAIKVAVIETKLKAHEKQDDDRHRDIDEEMAHIHGNLRSVLPPKEV